MVTSDFTKGGGGDITEFLSRARGDCGGFKKWYIGSEWGETTINFVFSDPEIGGNVLFDFIFTIGNPPSHPGRICTQPPDGHFGHPRRNRGTHPNLISQVPHILILRR